MRIVPLLLAMTACGSTFDNVPANIQHVHEDDDGYMHARSLENMLPYFCMEGTGVNRRQVPCPTDVRPDQRDLSCDASGCHGNYTYTPDFPASDRHLDGASGPSCFTCHDREWDDDRTTQ